MSVLKVILIGHLGHDPELRSFPDGGSVCNISVAHTEKWKDKQTGQQQEKTEWCRVVLRDRGNYRMAQLAGQYLRKGSKVYIEGKLQTRKWQDAQGVDRYTTEIVASEMQMLDSKPQDQSYQQPYQQQPNQGYHQPQQNHMPPPGAHQQAPQNSAPPSYGSFVPNNTPAPAAYGAGSFDKDIPF